MKKIPYIILSLLVGLSFAHAAVVTEPVRRNTSTLEVTPNRVTDSFKAAYFTAASTTATSTFAGDISFENAYATVIPLQDTASNLSSIVPLSGQTVYETDTTYTKVGDGVTTVGNLLPTAHIYYTTSNVGVGTTSPYAKLSVAGQVVGEYYTATSTTATSTFSGNVVIGTPRVMAGGSFVTGAFASGYSNTTRDTINSNGKGSFATGYVSSSFGTSSITATGNGAVAIGSVDSSPGGSILATAGSIAVGSAVNGRILKSVGSGSYAGGRAASGDVVSSGTGSFIWGDNATSSGSLSIAFGSGYTNSTNNTFTVGFSSSPTLTVNSTNVGIGTTSPYAKLSVAGQVVADYYSATSTTATSTFSGNVNVVGNGIKFEYLSAPSAPTVALAGAGAGNVNNGSHIYSMTCVTEEGETENSSTNSVTVTNNATDGKVTVTLPTCSSNTTVARKVWRGVANNAFSVYLLTTINDNTTTSYTDNTADASLGNRTPEPTSGPQGGKTGVNTTAGTLRLGDSNTIKINQYGGMNFSSPNASLVFPQNAIKPIVLYNTSNQEQSAAGTGVEYGSMYYSGNILHLGHFIGTVGGSAREVQLHSNGQGSNFYMSLYRGQTAPKGWFDFAESGGTSIGGLTFARFNPDTWTASFGTNTLLNLSGTINMSGTAGYRMLDINPTETATGSGERKLIRAAVGSTELFTVGSNGNVGLGSSTPYTKLAVSGQVVVDNINATSTTATSTFSGHLVQGQNIVSSYLYPSFTYSTSTAWTGTTTIPLGVAFNGETWRAIKCFTDTGTVNVSVNDGTNRMNMFTASTTVGNVSLSTNNIFTESEKRYVDLGTPVSSPTKLSCTVQKTLNVE